MRMGEVRGLRWEDVGDGLVRIRNNWIDGEGSKAPKCKGGAIRQNPRTVPLPSSIAGIRENVLSSGIPCYSSRNFLRWASRSRPKVSMSSKSSPLHSRVDNPITSMSVSLCCRFPHCRRVSATAFSCQRQGDKVLELDALVPFDKSRVKKINLWLL